MKGLGILVTITVGSLFTMSLAFANPGMLPKHPGYPAKGASPVTGQSTANDSGQTNGGGDSFLNTSAASHDAASMNNVTDPNRARIKKSGGAGRLPEVDGALNRVKPNPTGAAASKMN
ncbi:MAG: hypothetical protein GKS05_09255 [Nitrospirales bacterium]|nr:hypothetical protein [Nitrospirales bacterium]